MRVENQPLADASPLPHRRGSILTRRIVQATLAVGGTLFSAFGKFFCVADEMAVRLAVSQYATLVVVGLAL